MIALQKLDWRAKLLILWVVLFSLIVPVHIVAAQDAAQDVCQCVTCGQIPVPGTGQWNSVAEMCAAGELLPNIPPELIPPPADKLQTQEEKNAYAAIVRKFLEDRKYQEWIPDAHFRFTGDIKGCPVDGILSFGTHNLVRIWYSKPVIKWMCSGRQGELPDGAMIVKEEWIVNEQSKVIIDLSTYDPVTGTYEMGAPQNLTDAPLVVPMIKRKSNSFDGWYWAGIAAFSPGNPPLVDRSAFENNPPVNPTQPDPAWYPTGLNGVQSNVGYTNNGFGLYCVNCHSMAVSEATFSATENLMGNEPVYHWGPGIAPTGCKVVDDVGYPLNPTGTSCPNPFPSALANPNPMFLETFPELGPVPFQQTYQQRFPAETYDRVVVGANGPEQFVTMDQCVGCHAAEQNNNGQLWNMILAPGPEFSSPQYALAPDEEWRWAPMGLAGRDPVFLAQLESELNIADRQAGLAPREACIQTLCLSCHGSSGQRQLALDTSGQGPPYTLCNPLLPPNLRGDPSQNGPLPFTRDLMALWDGNVEGNPEYFKYGNLGREGITCTICHHATDQRLGSPDSFTGNLKFGPANDIYGPFLNPKQVPMQQAIDTTPLDAPWIKESDICGSCHTI